jgi:hypothetical protein
MHNCVEQPMAWSQRKQNVYYYKSRRIGRHVVKDYIGRGPAAELVAQADAINRDERRQRAAAAAASQRQYVDLDLGLKRFHDESNWLIRAALVAAGHYQHARGKWRRRPTC